MLDHTYTMLSRRTTAVLSRAYATASASTSAGEAAATPRRRQIVDTGDGDLVAP
jgi:hypothetical protein